MVNLSFGGANGLTQGFNWVFLIELIVVVVVVIFLLFFFNRVFGFCVSYLIRTYTWHRYKAYIHIEAIQLSFLAGRILFKNFRYQSRNESLYILKGHITWRYWLRRTRVRENGHVKEGTNAKLPCRVVLTLEGAEWFVYNRTPAYDAIIASAGEGKPPKGRESHENGGANVRTTTTTTTTTTTNEPYRSSDERTSDNASLKQHDSEMPVVSPQQQIDEIVRTTPILHLLPVQVICRKGSIVLGNTNTPSIVVAQFVEADLSVDAAESRSKFDLYRMVYNAKVMKATVQLKMNIDYKETLLARASHVVEKAEARVPSRTTPTLWRTVRDMIPFFQESSESLARPTTPRSDSNKDENSWRGLSRYTTPFEDDEATAAEAERDPLLQPTDVTEYAKVTTVLDSSELQMVFYYDEPGRVPPLDKQLHTDELHIGNGDLSPEWGLAIEVSGGTISYGPWADRQRGVLQEMFFPGTYEDATVAPSLKVGDTRVYAYFKVLIEFKDNVIFKIPTKEKSKDWRYSTQYLRSSIDQRVTTRPFGWIELKAGSESTITYHMGLTPRQDGWTNFLNLELKKLRVTTSINYGIFTEAEGVRVQCDLSNPLIWSALHSWTVNITIFKPSIFLLRDHITLFSDCGGDWTSGGADYATWIPYVYTLNINFVDFSLFLNVNDGNIISSPSELNDNSYLTFRGAKMSGKVVVPSDKISPIGHAINFEWNSPAMALTLHAPVWNTLSVLLSGQEIGNLHKLELVGSYTYPSDVSRNNIETLDLQVSASYVSVVFYGFLLRYLFNVRNNYFGEHVQFVTLEEYQRDQKLTGRGQLHAGKRPPVSNVLDVVIAVEVAKGAMILPSRLYEVSEGVRMHFDMLEADVRFMDYYMDLQINVTPISCFHHLKEPMEEIFEELGNKVPEAFINGLTVHAHRLLGKPPSNPAYICNWDFDVGLITGEAKIPFLQAINSAIDSFVYNLDDIENALPEMTPLDRDITLLRFNAAGASMKIPVEDDEIHIQLGPTTLGADDRTSLLRSLRATINIESFTVRIRRKGRDSASFNTALRITMLGRRPDLLDHGPKQSHHVREHDAPSRRAWFLYSKRQSHSPVELETFEIDLPPLPQDRIANIHSQSYIPRCTLPVGKSTVPDIHLSSSFLPPNYGTGKSGADRLRKPVRPKFKDETRFLHSSYSDIVLTHVDNLPPAQKTFIVEVSEDTKLLLTPDVIESFHALFAAMEINDPVAALDLFQLETVAELLASNRDRSVVLFTEVILPRMQICLQGHDGLGLLIDIVDLAPQFRSVHYKVPEEGEVNENQESTISVIASLRKADAIVYRHNRPRDLKIPEITDAKRDDLAKFALGDLQVKVRQGLKILGSISVGDIEGTINSQELDSLVAGVNHWLDPINQFSSAIQTISARRLCKSRNLITAIVLAGDQNHVSSDPPYLTRPSHVLRISKNLLRVNDTWKIASRVRHITRSLPPEVKADVERQFLASMACTLDSMDPVFRILSRWRSWEMSNIQESYFFKWLSGHVDAHVSMMTSIPIEGVLSLDRIVARYDTGDGKDNSVVVSKLVVNCAETPEPTAEFKATNVIGVDFSSQHISVNAATDVLDLVKSLDKLRNAQNPRVPVTDIVPKPSTSPPLMIEYRGTILINQFDISALIATLGLSMAAHDLRVSAFSQLLRTAEYESPSFNLSFQRLELAALEKRQSAAVLVLEKFASQMLTLNQRPGLAASLSSVALRLAKPIPWLIMRASETISTVKNELGLSEQLVGGPEPFPLSKPNLPAITFRLNQASVEAWLVPDVLLVQLSSKGVQTVLGELADYRQWTFLDVPPATVSLHRTTGHRTKLAELSTPFIAVKMVMHWYDNVCRLNPDVHVGTLALTLRDLATFFQTLATEEVTAHIEECQDAFEEAQKLLTPPSSAEHKVVNPGPLPVSYRLRSKWESIQVIAQTPDSKILFACSEIHISLTNRSRNSAQLGRILFTAGSHDTSLSLISTDADKIKTSILDMHWEVGNSFHTDEDGSSLYRLYFVSDTFMITLSPQSISKGSRALQYIVQEVEKLQIAKTLKDLNIGPKRLRHREPEIHPIEDDDPLRSLNNFDAVRVRLSQIKFKWIANDYLDNSHGFTFKCNTVHASVLDRATKARFMVRDAEIELNVRNTVVSSNYARLPKLDLNVQRRTEEDGWQLQLDAHGDTVQVNITPACIEGGHAVLESISTTAADLRSDFPPDESAPPTRPSTSHSLLEQTKKLKAVVTCIDFSGARVNAQYDKGVQPTAYMSQYKVEGDGCDVGSLQIPGLALRSRFARRPRHVFHAEICILESANVLSPQIKPFIHDILHSIERVMSHHVPTFNEDSSSPPTDDSVPSTAAILGDLKFSVGLRVQSQELTLSCDPFSKVDANVGIKEIYATLISCQTATHNQTFAMTVTVSGAHASLQHQYSGIASANIKLNDLNLSMFNNYQIRSSEPGISAILKSSAFEVSLNARQGQDFLIFNSLWLEGAPVHPVEDLRQKRLSNPISMQQLQKVAASPPSFPLNITILIDSIKFALDLGQSIGTTDLEIRGLRISNRKCSEFHHCIFVNIDGADAESRGRFSGYMHSEKFMVQTSIYFQTMPEEVPTPLVQIDVKLEYVEFRASFEYHVFLIGDSRQLRFTIYNRRIHHEGEKSADRLVFLGDSELLQLYATAEGPALVLSLYNAVIQLKEEKEQSRARELESFSESDVRSLTPQSPRPRPSQDLMARKPFFASRVDIEMAIKFQKINIGIFKTALNDSPVFRVNISNIRALFSQTVSQGPLENQLNLSLGTLRIALSQLKRMGGQELGEMKVERWIKHVSTMRGGVILAVPETEGSMWTKRAEDSDLVEHIFKSKLDGKVDIGWNYGSVMYVQELWKTFELKLKGREERRVMDVTGVGVTKEEEELFKETVKEETVVEGDVVRPPDLPVHISKRAYSYFAVEPAIIETPQLRQMGDATPPVEWIGVNRMKLPAFTHQAIIVPLQRVSKRVEVLYNLTLQSGVNQSSSI